MDFQVHAIAEPKTLALALCQKRARLLSGLGLDAPILDAGHLNGRIKEFALFLG